MEAFVLDFKQYRLQVDKWLVQPYYEAVGLVFDHKQLNVEHNGFNFEHWFNHLALGGEQNVYLFPVVAHIHSGISLHLYTHEEIDEVKLGYDDTFGGFIVVDKSYYDSQEDALNAAKDVIDEWNLHLDGEVYQYEYKIGKVCETCGHVDFEDCKESEYQIVYGSENLQADILETFEDILEDHIEGSTADYDEFVNLLAKRF